MGVVYKAEDTRLHRSVALKVLPERRFGDPSARERFEREAEAASALSHPHICTVHDIGEREGQPFLVMEHLQGRTLQERIGRRPLATPEILELGLQIADALEAATAARSSTGAASVSARLSAVAGAGFASPKSSTFASPRSVMKMLAGLVSRWPLTSPGR